MTPAVISAAIAAVIGLIQFLVKARADVQQNAEWTDAQRADFDAKLAKIPELMHWQPND
jgi:hypothetical protein